MAISMERTICWNINLTKKKLKFIKKMRKYRPPKFKKMVPALKMCASSVCIQEQCNIYLFNINRALREKFTSTFHALFFMQTSENYY